MREKIENLLHIEVSGVDLTALTDIEFYVKQGSQFLQYTPLIISATEMVVKIPFDDARCLKQGTALLQFAFTENGTPRASEIEAVNVYDLLKNAGYNP